MINTLLGLAIEFFPLAAFFVSSYYLSFLDATLLYTILTAGAVLLVKKISDRLPYLSLIFGFFVITSGTLSIFFHNPQILILADTVYFLLGAGIMLWSLHTPKTIVERLFGYAFDLTTNGWRIMTWLWVIIFIIAGVSNEIVRLTMTPEWWIGFQFWRALAINASIIFLIPVSRNFRNQNTTDAWGFKLTSPKVDPKLKSSVIV